MASREQLEKEFRDRILPKYPRKERLVAGFTAYALARADTSCDDIEAGVERFSDHLPGAMCYVPHISTWINEKRWTDVYQELPTKAKPDKAKSDARAALMFEQTRDRLKRLREA